MSAFMDLRGLTGPTVYVHRTGRGKVIHSPALAELNGQGELVVRELSGEYTTTYRDWRDAISTDTSGFMTQQFVNQDPTTNGACLSEAPPSTFTHYVVGDEPVSRAGLVTSVCGFRANERDGEVAVAPTCPRCLKWLAELNREVPA
jgi:hypothetical protein